MAISGTHKLMVLSNPLYLFSFVFSVGTFVTINVRNAIGSWMTIQTAGGYKRMNPAVPPLNPGVNR